MGDRGTALPMTRREILRGVATLVGGALSSSLVAAVLGCDRRPSPAADWAPRTLSPERHRLVAAIAELILPATDTPGAAAAGVDRFIDLLLSDWLDDNERDRFLAGLDELEREARERFGRAFLELTTQEQIALLEPLDAAAAEVRRAAVAAGLTEVEEPPFFGMMKEMTLVGYYTSEIGMTQELQHLRVAGSYHGCMPLAEVGRSWA